MNNLEQSFSLNTIEQLVAQARNFPSLVNVFIQSAIHAAFSLSYNVYLRYTVRLINAMLNPPIFLFLDKICQYC